MKVELDEMKESNEKILKRWRDLGFLQGLKEGSQSEWRCAKSFELLAQYFLINGSDRKLDFEMTREEIEKRNLLEVLTFPIVRRLICGLRPRVNRIIQPEEIVEPFKNVVLREIFEIIPEERKGKKEYEWIHGIIEYYKLFDKHILDAISDLSFMVDLKMLKQVFKIDIEATIVVLFTKYLGTKLNENNKKENAGG